MVVLALVLLLACACGKKPPSANGNKTDEHSGEPQHYSATVVRTVLGGKRTEVRIARSGEMRREEWTQEGETRVIIWRPDLGRVFHLSVDRQLYVESDIDGEQQPANAPRPSGHGATSAIAEGEKGPANHPETVDRALGEEAGPERVETEGLPDEVVDGHTCRVLRRRASFVDGHVETALIFQARDLEGLAIRMETETEGGSGRVKVITERRDIRTEVSPEQFVIPADFRRVRSLGGNR
jgi:hypothetical protein